MALFSIFNGTLNFVNVIFLQKKTTIIPFTQKKTLKKSVLHEPLNY